MFSNVRTVTTSHSMILGKKCISFRSQRIIAPSRAVEIMLLSYFKVKADRIRLIRNIPRQLHLPSENEIASFKKSLRLTDDSYIIAGIGRLHPEKGFDILLRAINSCKKINLKLVIAGSGIEKNSLQKYADANKLDVIFLDEISHIELLYSVADIVVMPSRRESVSLVAIEAAYFSKPVIATNVGGLTEIIKDQETGLLVMPDRPEAIALAINKLYLNKEMGKQIGKQLHHYVTGEYDPSKIASCVEGVYTQL